MDRFALLDRLTDLISHSKQMEEQIRAIQVEIENIYKEISSPVDQEEAVLKLLPTILEQIKQLPKSQKFIDVPHYKFIKRSLTEIQDEIEDTSSNINEKFPDRSNKAEEAYFKNLHAYIDGILNQKLPSRYRVSPSYEDGLDIITPEDVARAHRRHDWVKEIQYEPYIGRIDFYDLEHMEAKSYYIGEQSFENDNQELLVIRWSDDRANIFYENRIGQAVEYSRLGKIKLDYIRKIGTKNKQLKLYVPQQAGVADEVLLDKLSSKRGTIEEMELITSTISRSQNRLIRSELNQMMIIQGSAGTGKSIIALYRISYILDKYRNKLRENSVAFFGPNNLFLKHISSALKGLGNEKITKTQIDEYLQKYLRIKSLNNNLNNENIELKGSMDFKNYIQYYTECLLGNIKPWLTPLSINMGDKEITVHAIDVAVEYEKTLRANYNERKNMLFNALSNSLKDAISTVTAIEKALLPYSRDYSKELARFYLPSVKDDIGLDKFNHILSSETIQQLLKTAKQIKKDNKKKSNEFVNSAMTKEARNLQEISKSLVIQDLKDYFDSLRSSVEKEINENYYTWVCNNYKEIFDRLIEYELNQEIKKAFSDIVLANDFLYIEKLEDIINNDRLEEVEKKIQYQFMRIANDKMKQLASSVVDETKDVLIDLFFEEVEDQFHKQLNQIIGQTFDSKIEFKRIREFSCNKKSSKTDKITFEKELNQFLNKGFFKDPQEIHQKILKDSLQIRFDYSEKMNKISAQKGLTNFDLPALLLIMIMMQGTGYHAPLQYAVVDEAQDLRPFTIWAIRQLVSTDGLIMFGDLGQNLNQDNPLISWEEYASLLGDVNYFNLDTNFRSTKEIFDYSNAIIKPFAEGKYDLPDKCYLKGEKVREYLKGKFVYEEVLIKEIRKGLSRSKAYETVAILCKEENEIDNLKKYQPLKEFLKKNKIILSHQKADEVNNDKQKLIIMTVKESKGLQFDYVIIPNCSAYCNSDYDLKLLYVATSRALHELVVLNKIN